MKNDERLLLDKIQSQSDSDNFPYARDVAKDLNIPPKRAAYIYDKWTRKGWYEYGVSVMAGWLTDEGMVA